jgi:hypothetical protein
LWIALISFIAIGYLSNVVSAVTCQQQTRIRLEQRLRDNQASGTVESGPASGYFPWIVSVRYAYHGGFDDFEAGTDYYLSIFGFSIEIHRSVGPIT